MALRITAADTEDRPLLEVSADKDDLSKKRMEKLLHGRRLIIETLFDKLKLGMG